MNWTFSEFHLELKDLEEVVKKKAIEIANDICASKSCTKAEAIREGIKKAEEWFLNRSG